MKRTYIYALTALLFAASACVEPVPEFRLDTDAIEIGAEGGDVCVSLDSPEAWIAKTQDPWITVTPANGNASTQCTIMIDTALNFTPREGLVRIELLSSGERKDVKFF